MVKPRARTSEPTNDDIERFGNQAEKPALVNPASKRVKDPKVTGINFRMTSKQQRLLQLAAEDQDVSQQKILERIVWPSLDAKYPQAD